MVSVRQRAGDTVEEDRDSYLLYRFRGLPPNSKMREYVVPQKPLEEPERPKPKAYSMTWVRRLKRVFAIDPNAARSRNVRSVGDLRNAARSDHRIYRRP